MLGNQCEAGRQKGLGVRVIKSIAQKAFLGLRFLAHRTLIDDFVPRCRTFCVVQESGLAVSAVEGLSPHLQANPVSFTTSNKPQPNYSKTKPCAVQGKRPRRNKRHWRLGVGFRV